MTLFLLIKKNQNVFLKIKLVLGLKKIKLVSD